MRNMAWKFERTPEEVGPTCCHVSTIRTAISRHVSRQRSTTSARVNETGESSNAVSPMDFHASARAVQGKGTAASPRYEDLPIIECHIGLSKRHLPTVSLHVS